MNMTLVNAALVSATFADSEVHDAFKNYLETLERDLHEIGYEPSSTTEDAATELENALNEADEDREELEHAIEEGAAEADVVEEDEEEAHSTPE